MTDDKKETSTHLSEPTYQSTTQTSNEHHQTSGPSAPVYVENATGLNDSKIPIYIYDFCIQYSL